MEVCVVPHTHTHTHRYVTMCNSSEGRWWWWSGGEAVYSGLQLHPQIGLRGRAVPPGRDSAFHHQNQAVTLQNLLLLLQAKEHSETLAEPDESVK